MILQGFLPQLLHGTWVTVQLALCSLALGLVLGIAGAAAKLSRWRWCRTISWAISELIRGVPELLVLFIIYFGGTILLSKVFGHYIEVSSFVGGVVALGLIFAAYATETFRGAYLAISHGQWEAAQAYGMSAPQAFFRIMLPQLWRHALPGLGNLWFVLLKDTALVSLVGLTDLMTAAQSATAYTKQPFTFYLAAGVIYLMLTTVSMLGQRQLEKYYNRYHGDEDTAHV